MKNRWADDMIYITNNRVIFKSTKLKKKKKKPDMDLGRTTKKLPVWEGRKSIFQLSFIH